MGETGLSFGAYRLLERLGKGGMGETWHAVRDDGRGVSKDVVIKRILRSVSDDPQFVEAFISEARLSARLSHGNVAQVFEFGEEQGEYFMALEYVHGQSLAAALHRARERGLIGMPPAFAVYVAMEMLKGLHHAHKRTGPDGQPLLIVHRDVSPDNVLLSYEGEVKMVDFGIAKAQLAGRAETEPGTVKGKYLYFSPEQAHGDVVDLRTDVFATGVVLYSMLAGRLPLEGQPHVVLHKLVRGEFPSLSAFAPWLPASVERIVRKAMAPRREDRYPSALEFQQALSLALRDFAPDASQVTVSGMMTWLFGQELSTIGRTVVVPAAIARLVSVHQSEVRGDSVVTGPGVQAVERPAVTAQAPATHEAAAVNTVPGARKMPAAARIALIAAAAVALTVGIIVVASPEEQRNQTFLEAARAAIARGDLIEARRLIGQCKKEQPPCVGGDTLLAGAERDQKAAEPAPLVPSKPDTTNPDEHPEELQRERQLLLAQAEQFIARGDWDTARAWLQKVKIDGKLDPEAQHKLEEMNAEQGMKDALDQAEELIARGQLKQAKELVSSAERADLLKPRYNAVSAKLAAATEQKLAETTAPPPPMPGDVVKHLTDEGRTQMRNKDYSGARKSFTDCIKIDPKAYDCAKLLGSTYARLEQNTESVKWYRKYLELAPPYDPDRIKVEEMLKLAGH